MGNNVSQSGFKCEVCHDCFAVNEIVPVQLCLDDYRYLKGTFIGLSKKQIAFILFIIIGAYSLGKSCSDQLLIDKLWSSGQEIKSLTNSDKDFN